jgi:hypothetical protein
MEDPAIIAALHTMRTNPAYQNAEAIRRAAKANGTSVAAMATAGETSPQTGALMLLIGTWEVISLLAIQAEEPDLVFEVTPISQMWAELGPAVRIFRSCCGSDFAKRFDEVAAKHKKWVAGKKKGTEYETSDCDFCMHALFG